MNYYPFHIGDYASATRHLSWNEDAAYRRLIDAYYIKEGPLPAELRQVFRLVMAQTDEQREAVETVLNEFFELTPEGWRHSRCDNELLVMLEKKNRQRGNANARWDKHRAEVGNATAMPRHSRDDATAQKQDADAMPPTPTPTPTPKEKQSTARKRAPIRPESVPDSVWQDFLAIRRAKRAPLTDTALDGIANEAAKAGMSLAEALAMCCQRGWQGFNAGWVVNAARAAPNRQDRISATVAELTGRSRNRPEVVDVVAVERAS